MDNALHVVADRETMPVVINPNSSLLMHLAELLVESDTYDRVVVIDTEVSVYKGNVWKLDLNPVGGGWIAYGKLVGKNPRYFKLVKSQSKVEIVTIEAGDDSDQAQERAHSIDPLTMEWTI
jgi:hypothetical protein